MSKIEDEVCQKIQQRAEVGLAKYGVSLERTDLSQKEWLQHIQEELMDATGYIERCVQEADTLSRDDKEMLLKLLQALEGKGISMYERNREFFNITAKKLQDALNLE